MTFEEAFKDEIEKLGVVGSKRPLSRLLSDSPPEVRKALAENIKETRRPFLAEKGRKVISYPASHEMARVMLAGARGGALGAHIGRPPAALGKAFGEAQGVREQNRAARLVSSGKVSKKEMKDRGAAMQAFPNKSFEELASRRYQAAASKAKENETQGWKDSD